MKGVIIDHELIVDSYEQPIERPRDYQEERKYYSGKKATHITALPDGRDIVDVVIGKPGPTRDKKIFDEGQSVFDLQQKLIKAANP